MTHNKETFLESVYDTLDMLTDWSIVDYVTSKFAPGNYSFKVDQGLGRNVFAGVLLGIVLGTVFPLWFMFPSLWRLWASIFFQCIYHFMEFIMTAFCQPQTVGYHSFLFYHSFDYSVSRLFFTLEFFFWFWLMPSLSNHPIAITLSIIAIILVAIGQSIRSIAMYTAHQSFTHEIATSLKPQHRLVTHGIYQYLRHPSYFGWYLWAVAMQVLLFNPITFIAAIYASHSFFSDRIVVEEEFLLNFFGKDFEAYAKRVPTRIPFISGIS